MKQMVYKKYFKEEESLWQIAIRLIKYFVCLIIVVLCVSSLFGIKAYFVSGWSMQPTIDYMDLIFVNQSVDKTSLKKGDIVTFNYGVINTHRIIKVNYDENNNVVSYTTKGDNPNITNEETFEPSKIIGKVVTIFDAPIILPHLGYITNDIQQHKNLVIIYLAIICLFVFLAPSFKRDGEYEIE